MQRQIGFAEAESAGKKRMTRRQRFLAEMEKVDQKLVSLSAAEALWQIHPDARVILPVLAAGLAWNRWMRHWSLFHLSAAMPPFLQGLLGWFVGTFVFYWWHQRAS